MLDRAADTGPVTAKSIREAVAEVVAPEPDNPVDALGNILTEASAIQAFEAASELKAIQAEIQKVRRRVKAVAETPLGNFMRPQGIDIDLKNAWRQLKHAAPYAECPYCRFKHTHGCDACRHSLWVNKMVYDTAPAEMRE